MKTQMRKPTGPGEILSEEFLMPLGLTQKQLADHLKCDIKVINRIEIVVPQFRRNLL